VPAAAMRSAEERAGMYAQEDAVLDWLAGSFFPANAGSRFVSIRQLKQQAESNAGGPVSRAELSEAASTLLRQTEADNGTLPMFVPTGTRYLSLADMFGLLTAALADAGAAGAWPASSQVPRLFGPMEIAETQPAAGARVPIAALMRHCAAQRGILASGAWTPVPSNSVPSTVSIDGVRLTAGQLLRAMAEAYVAPAGAADVPIKWTSGNSMLGERFPPTRALSERGAIWTVKPASIRFTN
jgi:hypothetical protein